MVNSQSDAGKGECLREEMISGYLEGTLTAVIKAACEVHLVSCDSCREKLATLMRLLQPDTTPEEDAAINAAIHRWQEREPRPVVAGRPRLWRRVCYAFAGLAAILVLGIALRGLLSPPATGEALVQELLQNTRPFPPQLSHQPYRELNATRSLNQHPDFETLSQAMTSRAATAWEQGRFDLVAGNYEDAVKNLTQAATEANSPPEVLNDLGVGYLQRNAEGDAERARQEFERALDKNDKFLPAIFNLAIFYEREGNSAAAETHWRRYLDLDSKSGWAQEVSAKVSRKDSAK